MLQSKPKQKKRASLPLSQSQPVHSPPLPLPPVPPLESLDHGELSQSEEPRLPDSLGEISIRERTSNIKTCVRFRPFSQLELQLTENGLGQSCVQFSGKTQVLVGKENNCFTVDSVYQPNCSQETVYNEVGHHIIEEIMAGYNGTLFAYGPTGSGKTYTMYGNLEVSELAGVVPRSVRHIFKKIQEDDKETEFQIRCSFLQLYRETLSDLVKVDRTNLKIKESPVRGIYVEGLTEVHITSEQQMHDLLDKANKNRTVRATRLNEHSSRSHTLFMLEITQRSPLGAETTGRLNLVDLAGSEKVSKSGAVGESLEQAKKINLSLSCLGNVIHALTTNSEHVPYRDSKLTRLLQESLGGNYKTSLIACMSMHQSAQEEIVSTLKFATRVKTIKNQFKMNVRSSSAGLSIIVELLKTEIEDLRQENRRLRELLGKCEKELVGRGQKSELTRELGQFRQELKESKSKLSSKLGELLSDEGLIKSFGLDMAYINQIKSEVEEIYENRIEQKAKEPDLEDRDCQKRAGDKPVSEFYEKMARRTVEKEFRALKEAHRDREQRIGELERENAELKKENFLQETKLNEQVNERKLTESKLKRELKSREYVEMEVQVLKQQVAGLVDSLCKAEEQLTAQLNEKSELGEQKFQNFIRKRLEFSTIDIAKYFKNNVTFNYGLFEPTATAEQLPGEGEFSARKNNRKLSFIENVRFEKLSSSCAEKLTTKTSLKAKIESIETVFRDDPMAKDGIIFGLKNELIAAYFINQQLIRIIDSLEWKQTLEFGKSQIRARLVSAQADTILHLQRLLDESTFVHKQLRTKLEQIQFDLANGRHAGRSAKTNLVASFKRSELEKDDGLVDETSPEERKVMGEYRQRIEVVEPRLNRFLQRIKSLQNQVLPLTYQNAIKAISSRNQFCKDLWKEISEGETFKLAIDNVQLAKSIPQLRELRNQNDRLQQKVLSLETELTVEAEKSQHFKKAIHMEQAKAEGIQLLSRESEVKLRERLLNECQGLSDAIRELTEYKQQEQKEIQEKLGGVLRELREGVAGGPLQQVLAKAEAQLRTLIY